MPARPRRTVDRPVAVVTGASAGVGRAVALAFARRGYAVALLARSEAALGEVARAVRAAGGAAQAYPLDVADAAAMMEAADAVAERFGRIDVWVNDAMLTVFGRTEDIAPDEFRRVTEVTYLGYVHGTRAALKHMRGRNAGTIVQVGSALAYRSIPLQSAYCAAKAAIRGFTDSLRCELLRERSRIRLTMVHLPAVNTPQFDWARSHLPEELRPVGTIHQPEAVAEAILRAARRAPRELWIGTSTIEAILGTMVAPAFLDRFVAGRAWAGQMTGVAADPGRPDNLFATVKGGHATRGRFSGVARNHVVAVSSTTIRATLLGGAVLALCGAAALGFAAGRNSEQARSGFGRLVAGMAAGGRAAG
ncbi:SDR family oxidoreductase, partial [Propylenella binzhouense]